MVRTLWWLKWMNDGKVGKDWMNEWMNEWRQRKAKDNECFVTDLRSLPGGVLTKLLHSLTTHTPFVLHTPSSITTHTHRTPHFPPPPPLDLHQRLVSLSPFYLLLPLLTVAHLWCSSYLVLYIYLSFNICLIYLVSSSSFSHSIFLSSFPFTVLFPSVALSSYPLRAHIPLSTPT